MRRYKQELGRQGEDKAAEFLTGKGFLVLERNYRYGHKEIDLVARDGNTIVFVEVKAGRSKSFGAPEERVNHRKQKNLIQAAQHYIQEQEISGCDFRFDVLALSYGKEEEVIDHIRNAFMVT
ncbi:MAG: YraN family protein [Candidatus Zixiibacteriota bacterium]